MPLCIRRRSLTTTNRHSVTLDGLRQTGRSGRQEHHASSALCLLLTFLNRLRGTVIAGSGNSIPLRLPLLLLCADRIPPLSPARVAFSDQHISPGFPATATPILNGRCARVPFDQHRVTEFADSLLDVGGEADSCLERDGAHVCGETAGHALELEVG